MALPYAIVTHLGPKMSPEVIVHSMHPGTSYSNPCGSQLRIDGMPPSPSSVDTTGWAITIEPAGGSEQPTSSSLARSKRHATLCVEGNTKPGGFEHA